MPRYIGIDSNTGYIFFDTGALDGAARDETPAEAVERYETFENVRGGVAVEYIEHSRAPCRHVDDDDGDDGQPDEAQEWASFDPRC